MIRGFLLAMLLVALIYALGFVLFVSLLPAADATTPEADGIVALTGCPAQGWMRRWPCSRGRGTAPAHQQVPAFPPARRP